MLYKFGKENVWDFNSITVAYGLDSSPHILFNTL